MTRKNYHESPRKKQNEKQKILPIELCLQMFI